MPFGIVKVTDSEGLARETGHAAPEGTPRQGEERDRPPHRGQRRARRMEEREVGATLRRGAPALAPWRGTLVLDRTRGPGLPLLSFAQKSRGDAPTGAAACRLPCALCRLPGSHVK